MALTEQLGISLGFYADVSSTQTLVGALRNVELSIGGDTIDAGHAGNFGWETKLAGQASWSASGSQVFLEDPVTPFGLDPAMNALRAAIMTRTPIAVEIRTPQGAKFSGSAIVTEWSISGDYDDVMEGSFEVEGAGTLTYTADAA